MLAQTTQSRHPWRTVVRTAFQAAVGLASLLPVIALAGGIDTVPGVVQVIGVAAAITRIMAEPRVERFLRDFVPWLASSQPAAQPTAGELGIAAYTAYGNSVGWRNHRGDQIPPWHELPEATRQAWVDAATAARTVKAAPPQ